MFVIQSEWTEESFRDIENFISANFTKYYT